MNAMNKACTCVAAAVMLVACGGGSPANSTTSRGTLHTGSQPPTATATASTLAASTTLTVGDAQRVAIEWVSSTGHLLALGPIGRSEFLRQRVAAASLASMQDSLAADLSKMADRLPIPDTELRLIETPITAHVTLDAPAQQAHVEVWSVVVFGAKDLGAPRVVFRTSELVLVVDAGTWKLASFTSTDGPTPAGTDALPARWDAFAVVAAWPSVFGGER